MSALETKVPPVVVVFITALLMMLARYGLPGWTFAAPYGRSVAAVVLALAVGVVLAGMFAFRRADTTLSPTEPERASVLVKDGIYRHTRNPMYLGMLLTLIAFALRLSHWLSLLLVGGYVLYMNRFQISVEERVLGQKFGAEYERYKSEVRRWL